MYKKQPGVKELQCLSLSWRCKWDFTEFLKLHSVFCWSWTTSSTSMDNFVQDDYFIKLKKKKTENVFTQLELKIIRQILISRSPASVEEMLKMRLCGILTLSHIKWNVSAVDLSMPRQHQRENSKCAQVWPAKTLKKKKKTLLHCVTQWSAVEQEHRIEAAVFKAVVPHLSPPILSRYLWIRATKT